MVNPKLCSPVLWRANLKMLEQFAGMASVLSGNMADLTQHADRSEAHIFEIADRGANNVEGSSLNIHLVSMRVLS